MVIRKREKIFGYLLLILTISLILTSFVVAGTTPWTVPGFVLGPEAFGATVNVTIYDNATGNFIEDGLTTSNIATGSYSYNFNINDGIYDDIDIVAIAYQGDSTGMNNEYTNQNVLAGTPLGFNVNVSMSHPLILTSPNNDSYFNYNYTNFSWEYVNFTSSFRFQIDTDKNFADPLNLNISDLPGNTTGNYSNYSMTEEQGLVDNTYFWRILAYNDTIPEIFDISSVFTFVVDTVAPLITGYNPLNNSWINNPSPELVLATNENANCLGNNSSSTFLLKEDYFGGIGTTSHNFTLNLFEISGEGENLYYVQCNDTAGNVGIEEVYTINLDTVAPNTTSNFTALNNTWLSSATNISLVEDDAVPSSGINWTFYCTTDACNPIAGTNYTEGVLISTEGSSVFRFASSDIAGNIQNTEEVIVNIDTQAPNTTDNFSQAGTWINYDAQITLFPEDPNWNLGDGSGVNWTKYCYSSESYTCTPDTVYSSDVTISDENITYFRYYSQDNVSNQQSIQTIEIKIDKSNPITTSNFTKNNTWVNSAQNIFLVANDTIDGRNVSGLSWTQYCTSNLCDPGSGFGYGEGPIIVSTEGESLFRYASLDNSNNQEPTQELLVKIDTIAPNTTDNFTYDNIWINFDAQISLFPEDPNASAGNGSGLNWTKYCFSSEDYSCVPDTEYVGDVTITDENITYFRYHSQDNVSNTQAIQTLIIKIDKTVPDSSAASITIDSGAVYSTDNVLDFTWIGFDDAIIGRNVSGIKGYYYNFTNEETTTTGLLDVASPGQLTTTAQGNQTIFIWPADNVSQSGSNIGTSVNSSIFVDTITPTYLFINQTNITEDSASSNFVFTINITEEGSGHAFTPKYRYRYNQSDSYSSWLTLTSNSGDEYELTVVSPAWSWNMNRFENLSIQINVTDLAGNENISEEFIEFVDDINDAPVLDLIANQTVAQGSLLQFNVTGYDVDNDAIETIILNYGANETNLTLLKINNTLVEVNWTPGNEYVGENYVLFTVSDGSLQDSQIMLINVTNVNDLPIFDPIANLTAYENVSFSYDINATDADLDILTYYDNTSLFVINSSEGNFSFIPVNSDVGNHTIEFNVSDGSGGMDSEIINLEIIDVFSELNFSVQDRIFNSSLYNATLTGGGTCITGCDFNESIFVYQNNGNIELNLTAQGYSLNTTNYSVYNDENYTVLLDDIANPTIGNSLIGYFLNDSGYYLNISVNASDNLAIENVSFDYFIDAHNSSIIDTSGIVNMTLEGENYNLILGPYSYSFDFQSNQTALDYYGNTNSSLNDLRVYVYVSNGTSVSVNTAPILASIGNLTATAEKTFSYTVVAADAELNVLTYGENSTLFNISSSLGNFSFTPLVSEVGNYSLLFNVTDSALTDSETINLEIIESYCGDQFCSSSETCTICSLDCGTCPSSSSSSSSSGGGGGGGSRRTTTVIEYVNQTVIEEQIVVNETVIVVNETCVNNFTCFNWEPINCTFGEKQERSCYDANGCTDLVYVENQTCVSELDTESSEAANDYQSDGDGEEEMVIISWLQNMVGNAGNSGKIDRTNTKPAFFTLFGLILIGLLTPIVLWKVNHKGKYYEISDLHAIIDGHEIHIRSLVAANKQGNKGEIIEQWESDTDDFVYENLMGKV